MQVDALTQHPEIVGGGCILSQDSQDLTAHRVAGGYGLVIGHSEREPHDGNDGVQDEGEEHALVEGDSLAAQTLEVGEDDEADDQRDDGQAVTHHGQVVQTDGKLEFVFGVGLTLGVVGPNSVALWVVEPLAPRITHLGNLLSRVKIQEVLWTHLHDGPLSGVPPAQPAVPRPVTETAFFCV